MAGGNNETHLSENQHTETGQTEVPNSTYYKEPTSQSGMLSHTDAEICQNKALY